jgi:hypothetical protein
VTALQQPDICDNAIAGSTEYDAGLHCALEADRNVNHRTLAERLIVEDIQPRADRRAIDSRLFCD